MTVSISSTFSRGESRLVISRPVFGIVTAARSRGSNQEGHMIHLEQHMAGPCDSVGDQQIGRGADSWRDDLYTARVRVIVACSRTYTAY